MLCSLLTPPNQSESPQVLCVWQEGHEDEAVQVQAFHKDPVVVCCQKINEQKDCHLTTYLEMEEKHQYHNFKHKKKEWHTDSFYLLNRKLNSKLKLWSLGFVEKGQIDENQ